MSKKYRYSIEIKITDNTTSKHSTAYMEGDDAKKLGSCASAFIEAASILVNLDDESLKKVVEMIGEKLKTP